ncbi:MAG: ParA family protein [Cyanobacteria bacterium P01_G01_bin.4]
MKIISITNRKGGVGKTSVSLHIAEFLSTLGKTVVVDYDVNRSGRYWLERADRDPSFRVVGEKEAPRAAVGCDYLVADTPAGPTEQDAIEIARGSDLTIVPLIPDAVSLTPTLELIESLPPSTLYRVLLTVVPPAPAKEAEHMRELLQGNNIPVFTAQIRRTIAIAQALADGLTVRSLPGRSRVAWNDFQALGKEILALLEAEDGQ